MWKVRDPIWALLVDITVGNVALFVFGRANQDTIGAPLALVLASVLVVLLADGWRRIALLAYSFVCALFVLLAASSWDVSAVLSVVAGLVFIVGVITGVVSSVKARLAELEAARAQTIGVVSHELRNHLAGVIGVTGVITDPGNDLTPSEMTELLQLAHLQALEAADVIDDLLTASRVERGVLDVELEPVDLCVEAAQVIRHFVVEGQDLPLHTPEGPVWAMADPHRVRQVLRNLITNADRYGGPHVEVSVVHAGPVASIVVSDDGDGVHSADEASIFLPYRRSRDTKPAPGSTGLGLWIARSLTRKMGGDLTYQRSSGHTIFEVTLRAARPPAQALVSTGVPVARGGSS
jgi:signal transduction histidine kinase